MMTPSSATGAADPLAAGAAVDALALGIGAAAADVDVAGALDAADAEPTADGVSGFASLLPHAMSSAPNTYAIVFVMRASKHEVRRHVHVVRIGDFVGSKPER